MGRRAAALTKQLLVLSRPPARDPEPISPDAVVASLEPMLRRLLGDNLRVVTSLRSGTAGVRINAGHLEQIVLNLAVNARDAMQQGGVLSIETAVIELDEGYAATKPVQAPPGSYVMLAVTDTGCGMDEHVKARLFEPFFTTKELGKGTGLGLATVYGIVKQSGGYIWVYSEPGQGTTFKLYFPERSSPLIPSVPPPTAPAAPAPSPAGKETVLVVEDEASLRRLVCAMLRSRGYEVLDAATGEEARRWRVRLNILVQLMRSSLISRCLA